MKNKIALFDIDKTIYNGYIIFPLSKYLLKYNILGQNCIENLYNGLKMYNDGNVNYETTAANLNNIFAKGLKGSSLDLIIDKSYNFLVEEKDKGNFFSYVNPIINKLREKGYDIYFITGEAQFVASATTKLFNVSGFISSEFEVKEGIFTGKVKKMIASRKEKLKFIKSILNEYNFKDSFAFGDSEGDIEMLNFVSRAICVNPTENLKKIASKKGWIMGKADEIEKILINSGLIK